MKKLKKIFNRRLMMQCKDIHGRTWTHEHVSFWNWPIKIWHIWFYNICPRFTPKNSVGDIPYAPQTFFLKWI
jgi:hypothetical protein